MNYWTSPLSKRAQALAIGLLVLVFIGLGYFSLKAILPSEKSSIRIQRTRREFNDKLGLLSSGFSQYTSDHGGHLPPMSRMDELQNALLPYLHGNRGLIDLLGSFLPNATLSSQNIKHIEHPEQMVALYQHQIDHHPLSIAVIFADGHFEHISMPDWPRLKKASKIK